jgi:superfamily II DNA or RNA helicase
VEPSIESETLQVLTAMARRDARDLAPMLAERALAVTTSAEPEVATAAIEALLRRLDSSREMTVKKLDTSRYRVGRRRQRSGYEVWIGDDAASCSCLDFGKAALGMCKHVLAVLARGVKPGRASRPAVRWDPIRPLTGPGDYLARIWLDRLGSAPPRVRELFQAAPAACPIDPIRIAGLRRAETIECLLDACRRDPSLAEPAVVPLLEREQESLRRGRTASKARELDAVLRGLKRPLFPYQRAGVARFLATGRLLLADDMGLGKTAQAIASCHALFALREVRRVLIVVPAPLKAQWEREWRMFTDLPIAQVEGTPEQRASIYRGCSRGALIANYEQLLRDLPLVQKWTPELAILDEAQRIKNWSTKTALVVKQIDARWRLVLTGTPMENRLDELRSIMDWVDEHALEPGWRLASWHAVYAEGEDGRAETVGARNLDTLRARLAPHMLRRVRKEVLAQLPPRRDVRVPVQLTAEQQAAHENLDQPIAKLVSRARNRPLTQGEFLQLMKLLTQQRMICNALVLPDFPAVWPTLEPAARRPQPLLSALGSPKLLELRERIADLVITQERKVVVFSQWRRMLELGAWACGDVLARAGVRAMFFTGQESARRRTSNIIAFHDDPAARVLFATDAGGVGLNLQRAASCCINLELPWNPAVLEQRIGRIYRLGQDQPVEVYNLVAETGIEARIAHVVGDKRALFDGLFDGTSDEVLFDSSGSFLTRMHELVAPAADEVSGECDDPVEPMGERDAEPEPPAPAASASALAFESSDLALALAQVAIRPLADGRVSLELPRSAAGALGGLLRALASSLDQTAQMPHAAAPPV